MTVWGVVCFWIYNAISFNPYSVHPHFPIDFVESNLLWHPRFCIAAIYVKYCFTTVSYLLYRMSYFLLFGVLAARGKSFWIGTIGQNIRHMCALHWDIHVICYIVMCSNFGLKRVYYQRELTISTVEVWGITMSTILNAGCFSGLGCPIALKLS